MKIGTVYHLLKEAEGLDPGTYVLVEDPCDAAVVILCFAGEDENGDICTTEHEFEIHRDYLVPEFFRPVTWIDVDE